MNDNMTFCEMWQHGWVVIDGEAVCKRCGYKGELSAGSWLSDAEKMEIVKNSQRTPILEAIDELPWDVTFVAVKELDGALAITHDLTNQTPIPIADLKALAAELKALRVLVDYAEYKVTDLKAQLADRDKQIDIYRQMMIEQHLAEPIIMCAGCGEKILPIT